MPCDSSGSLVDGGKVFDSSVAKGRPFTFKIGVGQVIRGWDEGVMKMSLKEKVGEQERVGIAFTSGLLPLPLCELRSSVGAPEHPLALQRRAYACSC